MDSTTYNLLNTIKGSIRWFVNRKPEFYTYENNFVAVFWKITHDQDHVYDMFNDKDILNFYYGQIKSTFENDYPTLKLDVKYSYGPIEFEGQMYSRIIYYYYDKDLGSCEFVY